MVRCSDGSYYVGITNDCARRVDEHNNGINPTCYTFKRRPVELVYNVDFTDVHDAISWEKHIKRWSRAKKEALVRGDEDELRKQSHSPEQPWKQRWLKEKKDRNT